MTESNFEREIRERNDSTLRAGARFVGGLATFSAIGLGLTTIRHIAEHTDAGAVTGAGAAVFGALAATAFSYANRPK